MPVKYLLSQAEWKKENAILLTEPSQRPKECSLIFDVKAMPGINDFNPFSFPLSLTYTHPDGSFVIETKM